MRPASAWTLQRGAEEYSFPFARRPVIATSTDPTGNPAVRVDKWRTSLIFVRTQVLE